MAKTDIYADSHGIIFLINSTIRYPIGWWQIAKDGFSHWFNHLSEKRWFTNELGWKFTELCATHFQHN